MKKNVKEADLPESQMNEYSHYYDSEWESKYIHMRRPFQQQPAVFFWKDDEDNGCFSNNVRWYNGTRRPPSHRQS